MLFRSILFIEKRKDSVEKFDVHMHMRKQIGNLFDHFVEEEMKVDNQEDNVHMPMHILEERNGLCQWRALKRIRLDYW